MTELGKTGEVKWFSSERGYGFILAEGKEYFVHYKHILPVNGGGFRSLTLGDKVAFTVGSDERGAKADNVRVITHSGQNLDDLGLVQDE